MLLFSLFFWWPGWRFVFITVMKVRSHGRLRNPEEVGNPGKRKNSDKRRNKASWGRD
jgi:hypothetical protein